MAKYTLIFSLLVLIGTAGLGFKTKGIVEEKIEKLKVTTSTLQRTESTLTTTKKDLATTTENLTMAKKDIEEKTGVIGGLQTELTASKGETEKATAMVKQQEEMITAKDKRIAELEKPPMEGEAPTSPALIAAQAEITDLKGKLTGEAAAKEAALKQKMVAEENLVTANTTIQRYRQPITQRGLTGRVVDVQPGYNFVVLDLGDKQGVTVNSPLLVMRGGQMVAQLKITSVEPRQSIADVVMGSVPKGLSVMRGDRVVFTGGRGGDANQASVPMGGGPLMPAGGAGAPPVQ